MVRDLKMEFLRTIPEHSTTAAPPLSREPDRVNHESMFRDMMNRTPDLFEKFGTSDEERKSTLRREIPSHGLSGEQIEALTKRYGLTEAEKRNMHHRVLRF